MTGDNPVETIYHDLSTIMFSLEIIFIILIMLNILGYQVGYFE